MTPSCRAAATLALCVPFVTGLALKPSGLGHDLPRSTAALAAPVTRRTALAAPPAALASTLLALGNDATYGAAVAAVPEASGVRVMGEGVALSSGEFFPLASFGLQVYDDEKARKLTLTALEVQWLAKARFYLALH